MTVPLTEAGVHAEIESQLPDNFMNLITAAIVRPVLHDIVNLTIRDCVSVKNYGAVGDGTTDDSTAILNAVNAAYTANSSVYFPGGIYRITQNAVLTQTVAVAGHGLLYFGDGQDVSILRLDLPGGAGDTYFYDNGATMRMQHNRFENLGFQGMNPDDFTAYTDINIHADGFRLYSEGHEQNISFYNCSFSYLSFPFVFEGDNTASENSWFNCKCFQIRFNILWLGNNQSFNHNFYATDLELIYGHVFHMEVGGGVINMHGGSVIMVSDTGSDTYFFHVKNNTSGLGSMPCNFNNVRWEFRGATTNMANLAIDFYEVILHFNGCLIEDQGLGSKTNFVQVCSFSSITFRDCYFYPIFGGLTYFKVVSSIPSIFGQNGQIIFENCMIDPDWSDRCTVEAYGLISARNCFGTDIGSITDHQKYAHDFDLDQDQTALVNAGSSSNPMIRLKTAQLKFNREDWHNEHQLKLPKNAIIKNIHLRKPADGTDATNVTFKVNRNDKTGTPHLTSNTDLFKNAHFADVVNYFYSVGTTTNERNLRLYPDVVPTQFITNGICVVEYY